jgi:lipoyl-dependent peroxiredoxin
MVKQETGRLRSNSSIPAFKHLTSHLAKKWRNANMGQSITKAVSENESTAFCDKIRYTAKTQTTGGRRGAGSNSDDGRLDVKFSMSGGPGTGTNPERLFAAGWPDCFISAIGLAMAWRKLKLPAGPTSKWTRARLATLTSCELDSVSAWLAWSVGDANQTCRYSEATRGNIDVRIN